MENVYGKIKSYDELLTLARALENDEQRVMLICEYFISNVAYNYASLEAYRFDKPSTGMKDMVQDIDSRYNAYNPEERGVAKRELEQKMREDMKSRYKDMKIAEGELKKLLDAIDNYYGTIVPATPERKFMMFGRECGVINATPERAIALVEAIRKIKNENVQLLNPTVMEDGLLKQGVCAQYAPYVKKYCNDLGIKCEVVEGQGTVKHVWNLVNINGKIRHLDLTNAIFIRDGYGDNPTNARSQDWFMATTEQIYAMQPCRRIERIGENKPNQDITAENFSEYMQFINDSLERKLNTDGPSL